MSKFWDVLKRTQAIAQQVNVRLAIVAVVLGVGGFAVYKGVQQMKPSTPTPKKVVKAGEEATPGKTEPSAAPEGAVAGGASGTAGAEPPLYGAGAAPQENGPAAYGAGGEVAPVGGVAGQPEEPPAYGTGGDANNQYAQEAPAEEKPGAPNRLRPPTRPAGGVGAYTLTDVNQESKEPAATEGASPAAEGALVTEVPTAETPEAEQPTATESLPTTRPPSKIGAVPANPIPSKSAFSGSGSGTGSGAGSNSEVTEPEAGAETRPVRPNPYGPKAGISATSLKDPASRHVAAPVSHALAATHGVPGERNLEGMQAPSVALEKLAPAEVQVGKLASFETRVRNVGQIAAHDVIVTDHVPKGTRLEATTPQATEAADGTLTWNLGTMQPGDEIAISMQITPEEEGEIGSVAQVGFAGKATARTISTRPLLKIEHTAPKQVMIGHELKLGVTITNPGSGAATGVIVEEDVPEGLSHVAGKELEYEIGVLRPGESRELELTLKAEKPGVLENIIQVHGEGNLTSEHRVQIEVISPQRHVGVSGPKQRFLDRQATDRVTVANPGTAAA
ncbi:MAG: DUF11 domain-containing protein, partial [Planctomycetales bacterium]|nr:DUF11 domain-containing protein [Planctomycetales bacterium]